MSKPVTAATPHQILAKAGPYPLPAYQFVQEGLRFTVRRVHEQRAHDDGLGGGPTTEHVSGQQLCMGLRDYAIERYGMLALSVLSGWNVHRTDDFGRIVFGMIDAGLFSKSQRDSIDDFRGVFDFQEAFSRDRLVHAIGRRGHA